MGDGERGEGQCSKIKDFLLSKEAIYRFAGFEEFHSRVRAQVCKVHT